MESQTVRKHISFFIFDSTPLCQSLPYWYLWYWYWYWYLRLSISLFWTNISSSVSILLPWVSISKILSVSISLLCWTTIINPQSSHCKLWSPRWYLQHNDTEFLSAVTCAIFFLLILLATENRDTIRKIHNSQNDHDINRPYQFSKQFILSWWNSYQNNFSGIKTISLRWNRIHW